MESKFGKAAKAELENNGVDVSTLELDKEYKFNHALCPAGADLKQRLYVINKGGAILYKCFNCGGSGHYREKESWSPIVNCVVGKTDNKEVPADYRVAPSDFTDEMMLWLLNYEIDPDEFPGVFTPAADGSLPISVYNGDKYVGYQRRYFDVGGKRSNKYVTNTTSPYHYLIGKEHPEVVFVVEDLLSSYKIWSLGYSVVALLGTSLKGTWPNELARPKQVVVWLDNDNAGHAGTAKFVKEMGALFPSMQIVFDRQPKEVPYEELSRMCGAFK